MYYYRAGQNSDAVASETYANKKLQEQSEKNIARNEKEYAGQLHMAGRYSLFKLVFESKKFEDQELKPIGTFEDVKQTHHFTEGVKRGLFMLKNEIIPEEYKEHYKKLIENGLFDDMFQSAIDYLVNYGIDVEEYLNKSKKHR